MDALLVVTVVVLFVAVAAFVAQPLLRQGDDKQADPDAELADLETRKQSKYREIRDAEMDYRSGKLSEADFKRLDNELRSEAIGILELIDKRQESR
jgi:hypothetical protein